MNPAQAQWVDAKINADRAPAKLGIGNCPLTQPMISVSWRDHDFDRVRKGATPPEHDLVITSTGTKDLANLTVTISGDQFQLGGGTPGTLTPGSSATVKVTFKPTSFGDKTGTIRVSSNAVNENPIEVHVKGKQYAVITFVVEDMDNAKLEGVKLKIKQAGEEEKEVTTAAGGKVEFETEKDGLFEVELGDWKEVLEFRSLTTA